jgi:hypothetical protein
MGRYLWKVGMAEIVIIYTKHAPRIPIGSVFSVELLYQISIEQGKERDQRP